jgi:hypothetical protein
MSEKAEKEIDTRTPEERERARILKERYEGIPNDIGAFYEDEDDESEPTYTYNDDEYDPDDIDDVVDIQSAIRNEDIMETTLNINTINNPTTRRVRIYQSNVEGGAFFLDSDFNENAVKVIYPDARDNAYTVSIYYFGRRQLTHEMKNRIRRAKLPIVHASITMNYYLADARADLIPLYPSLKGTGLRIRLDYIYDFNNGETLYLPSIRPNGIVLGLMNGKTCISSLLINIPTNKDFASFEYRTMEGIENWRLLTKLLITAAVIIMPKFSFPLGHHDHDQGDHLLDYLVTYETDPSLLQFMINDFNSKIDLTNDNNNGRSYAILKKMMSTDEGEEVTEVTLEKATHLIDEFAQVKARLMREQPGIDLKNVFREIAAQLKRETVQARNERIGKRAPSKSTSKANKGGRRRTRRHRKSARRHTQKRQRK